ncbi:hypothetical protein [Streptomyces venetus]
MAVLVLFRAFRRSTKRIVEPVSRTWASLDVLRRVHELLSRDDAAGE